MTVLDRDSGNLFTNHISIYQERDLSTPPGLLSTRSRSSCPGYPPQCSRIWRLHCCNKTDGGQGLENSYKNIWLLIFTLPACASSARCRQGWWPPARGRWPRRAPRPPPPPPATLPSAPPPHSGQRRRSLELGYRQLLHQIWIVIVGTCCSVSMRPHHYLTIYTAAGSWWLIKTLLPLNSELLLDQNLQ